MKNTALTQLNNPELPLYMRVFAYYRDLIADGKLQPGARLPSVRRCAEALSVSRTTAEAAYFQLAADGYIVSKPQSGYFVTDTVLRSRNHVGQSAKDSKVQNAVRYDFASLSADRESFDFALWRRYIKSALRQDERLLSYGEAQGEAELREALCKYITERRNAVCTAENIVIGAGVQSLLHILCSILPQKPPVYFKDPTFVQGSAVFSDHGYLLTDSLEEAGVIYVSPSHTNSWGDVMPTAERLALLRFAESRSKLLVEDDYDSEFGYFNRPSPSLQGLDGGRNVVYIGTFSKLLLPSIRLSFMILPDSLMQAYKEKEPLYNQTASKTEQIALCRFIRDGNLSVRVRRIKKLYAQKTKQLAESIQAVFGQKAELHIGETGFVVRMIPDTRLSGAQLTARAAKKGVALKAAEPDADGRPRLLLSCSAVPCEEFVPALRVLYSCIFDD